MGQIKQIIILSLTLLLVGACSSGDDSTLAGVGGGKIPGDKAKKTKAPDVPEADPVPSPFFQQNKKYSDAFIQNALDEKPDARVQTLLQSEKRDADRLLKRKKSQLNNKIAEVRSLENRKKDLEVQNSNKVSLIQDLENQRKFNRQEMVRLRRDIQDLQFNINNIEDDIRFKRIQLAPKQHRLTNKVRERDDANRRISRLKNDNQSLTRGIQRNRQDINTAQGRIQKLQGDLVKAKTALAKAAIEQKIQGNRRQIVNLRHENQRSRQQQQANQREINQKKHKVAQLNNEIPSLRITVNRFNAELRDLRRRQDQLARQKRNKDFRRQNLIAENQNIDQDIAVFQNLPNEIANLKTELRLARQQQQTLSRERDQARTSYKVKAQNYAAHTALIKDKVDELSKLEALNDLALRELYDTL